MKPISVKEINGRYLSWLNDPKVNQFLEVRHKKQSLGDIIDYVNGLRSKNGCELFAIFTRHDGKHVGNIAITNFDLANNFVDYGLLIGYPKLQKFGLGGEATILLLEYLFRYVGVRKVIAGVIAENEQSYRLIEHLGFTKEGTLRKHSILSSGEMADVYSYGILREEWLKHREHLSYILKCFKITELNLNHSK